MKITRNLFLEDTNVPIHSMICRLSGNETYQGLGFLLVTTPLTSKNRLLDRSSNKKG